MDRRDFLMAAAATTIASPGSGADKQTPVALEELTLADIAACFADGRLSSVRLTQRYLARIEALDRRGPALRAVLEINPRALKIAAALDRERATTGSRGLLHGVPVLIKDNVETADRMMTTAGSLALDGWYAPNDAPLVARLRAAGAVILGKTNLSEWANFRSTHSVSGWSGRGGQTRNPFALDRSPSGSSSGSAVAVSGNLCAVAVGTETDGSIVSPASINGIVGLKPTVGLISGDGIVPISHSQDTAGPLARTVRDAAVLLSIMAEPRAPDFGFSGHGTPGDGTRSDRAPDTPVPGDGAARRERIDDNGIPGVADRDHGAGADRTSADGDARERPPGDPGARDTARVDYARFIDPKGLAGARLGIARRFFADNAPLDRFLDRCVELLKGAGAIIVDPVDLPMYGEAAAAEQVVLLYEFKAGLNAYLARLPAEFPVRSLEELIRFNAAHPGTEMPLFDQELLRQAEVKGDLNEAAYQDARATCLKVTRGGGIDALLAENRLDALVTLTSGTAWLIDPVNGDADTGGCSSPAAIAGYPHITVPAGLHRGLPVGLSFFASAYSEPTLIRLASGFEHLAGARNVPRFAAIA
jgi:amidase